MPGFQLARLHGQSLPTIEEYVVAAGETVFEKGSLLLLTSGELTEAAGDPGEVDFVSLCGFGTLALDPSGIPNPSNLGARGIPPGRMQCVRTADDVYFSAEFVGDVEAAVLGVFYGVVKGTDGIWRVDFDEAGADVVELISKEWNQMLTYDFVEESVATSVTKGRNRVIVRFVPGVTEDE